MFLGWQLLNEGGKLPAERYKLRQIIDQLVTEIGYDFESEVVLQRHRNFRFRSKPQSVEKRIDVVPGIRVHSLRQFAAPSMHHIARG
jgi:hypothetical protein